MQRYNPIDFGNGCLPHELMEHALDGNYVLAEKAQAEIDDLHKECDRLTALLQWEQNRRERIGTHGPDCWKWGTAHYECALRKIEK